MKIILFAITLTVSSDLFAWVEPSIQIRAVKTDTYSDKYFVSIKDDQGKVYLVPRKSVTYVNKKRAKVFVEVTDREFREARNKCVKNKRIKQSLCPPKLY